MKSEEIDLRLKWEAALLSVVLPGAGYWILKRKRLSLSIFLLVLILLVYGIRQIFRYSGDSAVGISTVFLASAIWLGVVIHSFVAGRKVDRRVRQKRHSSPKDPFLAMGLSYLFPGIGQFYVRDYLKGIAFLSLGVASMELIQIDLEHFLLLALSAFSSYLAFSKIPLGDKTKIFSLIAVLVFVYGTELFKVGMVTILETTSYTYTWAGGPSMEPTIHNGDFLLIDLTKARTFRRGDIVSCKEPDGVRVDKRVVAFGGDTVEIRNGGVWVNGKRLSSPPFNNLTYVHDGKAKFGGTGDPYVVPLGSIYVLGDNSQDSYDSRYCGAIEIQDVRGVVYKIVLPFNDARLLLPKDAT